MTINIVIDGELEKKIFNVAFEEGKNVEELVKIILEFASNNIIDIKKITSQESFVYADNKPYAYKISHDEPAVSPEDWEEVK